VVSATADALRHAIDQGRVSDRLWLYSNYHCNLRCRYCLTESAPGVPRRLLGAGDMVEAAHQARALGFRSLGVTGGEPFLLPDLPERLAELARILPVLVLTNATLFTERMLARMRPLAELDVALQISLDSAEPQLNDEFRAPRNFERVVAAVPRLVELGIPVRIATTGDRNTPEQMERLCALHRSLGVPDEDHVVRPIVRRGRAIDHDLGVVAEPKDLFGELTLTADGAFWSPFAPTVHAGRLDTDLLLTRQRLPLDGPARALLAAADANPEGHDATLNIR
jgi:MoaA/NifB/PqqE/SkfB family radical SAM enzyme